MKPGSILKVPMSLSISSGSSSTGSSITNRAAQFISSIQSNFESRRDAVIHKINIILDHRFESKILTEPTVCSQCHELIWGFVGQECRLCKLASHRKCLDTVKSRCVINSHTGHRFEPHYFKKPTFCDHCGTMLVGITKRQGLECNTRQGGCGMNVHHSCEEKVSITCQEYSAATSDRTNCKPSGVDNSACQTSVNWSRISIDQFDILGLLGTGTFSKVYLANLKTQPKGTKYAIKIIKKTNFVVSCDPESAFTEMRALNLGRRYPFLTIGHCCFHSKDRLYYVMEFVAGHDLLYHLRRVRKFSEGRAKFHSAEIVLALRFLHNQGIVYRDLKLENVIVEKRGHCKLIDFGMSKELIKISSMRTSTFCGTPDYISPETIKEQEYGFSVDWWAMGVMLFEMLIGYPPFFVDDDDDSDLKFERLYKKIVSENIQIPAFLTDEARSILVGFLTKNPHDRLGCCIPEGCEQAILDHPFFKFDDSLGSHQWDAIETQRITPPRWPISREQDELEVEDGNLVLSPVDPEQLHDISQKDFDNFSFYSESFKSIVKST